MLCVEKAELDMVSGIVRFKGDAQGSKGRLEPFALFVCGELIRFLEKVFGRQVRMNSTLR